MVDIRGTGDVSSRTGTQRVVRSPFRRARNKLSITQYDILSLTRWHCEQISTFFHP